MIHRDDLVAFLADLLQIQNFEDYCENGLQVEGRGEVASIVCGVSASERLFQEAIRRGADTVLVHHGLFWKNSPWLAIKGLRRQRLATLIGHDLNLLAYHLPLDAHPIHGNNARIATLLGLESITPFDVGCIATAPGGADRDAFLRRVTQALGAPMVVFPFGASSINRVGILSGGGSQYYRDALAAGCDTFISGEISEHVVREVEEAGMNYIALGHYNSERWGPMSLAEYLPKVLQVKSEFVDIPNPV